MLLSVSERCLKSFSDNPSIAPFKGCSLSRPKKGIVLLAKSG